MCVCVCVCVCVLLPPMVCGAWLLVVGGQVQDSRLCVPKRDVARLRRATSLFLLNTSVHRPVYSIQKIGAYELTFLQHLETSTLPAVACLAFLPRYLLKYVYADHKLPCTRIAENRTICRTNRYWQM